jgi:hypothetical protein
LISEHTDWAQAVFDIGAYSGQIVKFKYRFGSDYIFTDDGWYLDAFVVNGAMGEGNPSITYGPMSFDIELRPGTSTDRTLTISNSGDGLLAYNLTTITELLSSVGSSATLIADPQTYNPDRKQPRKKPIRL